MSERLMVDVTRTYLEHEAGPPDLGPPPREGLVLEAVPDCPPELYLWLYRETGRDYFWIDRINWTSAQAAEYLRQPGRVIWMLREGALPVGWFEFGPAPDGAVEIVYFGLLPHAVGRIPGLGRWLLRAALVEAYRGGAARVVLNTCTLDHPAALPNYLARGFRPVRAEQYVMPLPIAADTSANP